MLSGQKIDYTAGPSVDVPGPFSLDINGVGRNILAMAISGCVFFPVTLLIEYKFFLPMISCNNGVDASTVEKERESEDEDVARERNKIACGSAHDSIVRLENLTKVFSINLDMQGFVTYVVFVRYTNHVSLLLKYWL